MKRVKSGRRVLTGQVTTGTYSGIDNRIQLFDGKFTTGYRVTSFQISPNIPASAYEIVSTLSTEPKSTLGYWNWQDVQEIAWAAWGIPIASRSGFYHQLRDDNMVIEDMWIGAYNSSGESVLMNYEIVLEKYDFPAWDGAGILVENLSQGGPQ